MPQRGRAIRAALQAQPCALQPIPLDKQRDAEAGNGRERSLGSLDEELQRKAEPQLKLLPGYHLQDDGTYEKLQSGRAVLMVIVLATFALIFLSPFTTFGLLKLIVNLQCNFE